MSHPMYHAKSSARKFGGDFNDYLSIHSWFDQTKALIPDARHRMVLHNAFGIFLCEQVFGPYIVNSAAKEIPTRLIAEQHVIEDYGWIPTLEQCFNSMELKEWMFTHAKQLSKEFTNDPRGTRTSSSDNERPGEQSSNQGIS